MTSKITTYCGAVAVVAGVITSYGFTPLITQIAGCVGACASGLGLFFARDNKVSDEQAGAKK